MSRPSPFPSARAFTLIELLVVMAIIAVLSGLMVLGIGHVRLQAQVTVTTHRMNRILDGLQTYAVDRSNTALAIQEAAGLGGALRFAALATVIQVAGRQGSAAPPSDTTQTANSWKEVLSRNGYGDNLHDYAGYFANARQRMVEVLPPPGAGGSFDYRAYWPARWPETDWMADPPGANPPVLRFPWGRPGLTRLLTPTDPSRAESATVGSYGTANEVANRWVTRGGSQAGARTLTWAGDAVKTASVNAGSVVALRSNGVTTPVSAAAPVPFDAGWMSPVRSLALLQISGVVGPTAAALAEVRADRNPARDWNDRWGNPLVVTFALFQPERVYSSDAASDYTDRSRDALLKSAEAVYGYNRSLYLSVVAPGPALGTGLTAWSASADAATLRDIWIDTRARLRAHEVDESAMSKAVGGGIRSIRDGGDVAVMTIPKEISQ
ncbi:MAG: hypothetical protein RLZZ127_250 [Planctomycetota bacterium]|jgi:prepilin-type N-terminal cleavage/methylation domain-containing protein